MGAVCDCCFAGVCASVYWIGCFLCILDLVINVLSNQIVLKCGHKIMNHVSQSLVQFCSKMLGLLKNVLVGPRPILFNFAQNCSQHYKKYCPILLKHARNTKKYWWVPANPALAQKYIKIAKVTQKLLKSAEIFIKKSAKKVNQSFVSPLCC